MTTKWSQSEKELTSTFSVMLQWSSSSRGDDGHDSDGDDDGGDDYDDTTAVGGVATVLNVSWIFQERNYANDKKCFFLYLII